MLVYKIIRENDIVYVGILKHKTTHKYHFINFTKEHICPCEFNTIQDAVNDLEKYKKTGKIINYIPQKSFYESVY